MITPNSIQDRRIAEDIWVSSLAETLLHLYQLNDGYLCEEHLQIMDCNAFVEKLLELDDGIVRVMFRGIQIDGQNIDVPMIYVLLHGNVSDPNVLSSSEQIDPQRIRDAAEQVDGSTLVLVRDIRAAIDVAKSSSSEFDNMKKWDLWIVNISGNQSNHKMILAKLMLNRVFAYAGINREASVRSVSALIEHIKTNIVE